MAAKADLTIRDFLNRIPKMAVVQIRTMVTCQIVSVEGEYLQLAISSRDVMTAKKYVFLFLVDPRASITTKTYNIPPAVHWNTRSIVKKTTTSAAHQTKMRESFDRYFLMSSGPVDRGSLRPGKTISRRSLLKQKNLVNIFLLED
jgi:hypothetical protein